MYQQNLGITSTRLFNKLEAAERSSEFAHDIAKDIAEALHQT
jgi:hypothetical protein